LPPAACRLSQVLIPAAFYLLPVICIMLIYSIGFAQGEFKYDAKGKRNPFIPLITPDGRLISNLEKKEGAAGLSLEGIIYDKGGLSYAIVNGVVVKISDKVGDYQVLKIEEKRVIFIKEGEPLEVELKKEE